jgi:hypothetical protein
VVNQYIWVEIAVGEFFAGLGIGIAVLQPSSQPSITQMFPQQMQQMMQDPQTMNQWMNYMMLQ